MCIVLAVSSKHFLLVKGRNVIWKSLSDNMHGIPQVIYSLFSVWKSTLSHFLPSSAIRNPKAEHKVLFGVLLDKNGLHIW